jgi:O-antigen ligase
MQALQRSYHFRTSVSVLLFLTTGVAAIILRESWLLAIPFGWLVLPPLYDYFIRNTASFFWLLLIALPLSAEINFTPQLGTDFPDEFLLILLTGASLVAMIHRPSWFPRSVAAHPLFLVLLLYFGWLIITCCYAVEPLLSFKYLLAKTWYIIPFVILPQKLLNAKDDIRKMARCLLLPMSLLVVQVLIRHALHGFSFEDTKYAMGPFFRNHVTYSAMLVCLLAVGWCVWKLSPKKSRQRKWVMAGLVAGCAGLVFAYSRGAWLALVLGIAGAWIIRKRWISGLIVIIVAAITVSTAWLVTDKHFMRFTPDHDHTVFHTDFGEHLGATVKGKDISTAERFYRWVAGFRMLADKPVTGFGPNAFYPHYRQYTVRAFETWVSDNPEHSTVHNYFILVALEQGLIGLLLFCLLYFGMLLHVQRLYHRLTDPFYRMIALTTGVVLIMIGVINFLSDMIETDKIGSLFWLSLGMIIVLERISNIEQGMSNVELK